MKYTAGKVRHIRDDMYQARFTWYEERQGKKVAHQVARNFRAGSSREAEQKRAAIHAQLEREAEIERIMPAKTEPTKTDIADYLYFGTCTSDTVMSRPRRDAPPPAGGAPPAPTGRRLRASSQTRLRSRCADPKRSP